MEGLELRDQGNATMSLVAKEMAIKPVSPGVDARERIKIEFYKTYDVMTGIRIAATLGGFFSMMILLVLYKNYCKPSKTLSEEQLNAAVTAAVEEEDRALKAALEATTFYTTLSKQRQSVSLENRIVMSPRFSSVGGGYSHFAPPMRFSYLQQRGKSLPGSALRFSLEDGHTKNPKDPDYSGGEEDEEEEEEDEDYPGECQLADYFTNSNYLSVPSDRRLSSITCSSADTSYLERRGSAFEMGCPASPYFTRNDLDKQKLHEEGPWDFYYPIDIQVIQPTPEISPAASAETLCEKPMTTCGLQVPGFHDRLSRLPSDSSEIGLAPLASISSLATLSSPTAKIQASSQNESNQGSGGNYNDDSVGSDSVFMDEEVGTEDEVEEFSTDSEFEYGGFDDDYSFCEASRRPVSRCQKHSLQFASFDSYDASIGQDTLSEEKEIKNVEDKPSVCVQLSVESRKAPGTPEINRLKRKLRKTNSEPRNQKVVKQLPAWIDKGRSGYVPKRQFSVPSSRRKVSCRESVKEKTSEKSNTKELKETHSKPAPDNSSPPDSSTESNKTTSATSTSTSAPQQGLHKDFRLSNSQDEKRRRLQKQKTVNEEWNGEDTLSQGKATLERSNLTGFHGHCNLLKLPQMNVDKGSCEKLNVQVEEEMVEEDGKIFIPDSSKSEFC